MAKIDEVVNYYYDKMLANMAASFAGQLKYRNKRVPVYLKVRLPWVEKHYCGDDWDDDFSIEGYLLVWKEFSLFKIGSKIDRVPYVPKRKAKGGTLTFARYNPLTNKEYI